MFYYYSNFFFIYAKFIFFVPKCTFFSWFFLSPDGCTNMIFFFSIISDFTKQKSFFTKKLVWEMLVNIFSSSLASKSIYACRVRRCKLHSLFLLNCFRAPMTPTVRFAHGNRSAIRARDGGNYCYIVKHQQVVEKALAIVWQSLHGSRWRAAHS